jgi:segregation and condensation protein A
MTGESYKVKLDDLFEGPMDLLLHLVKKNEVDIYDIPIALITDQFLSYIDWMRTMSIDFAGEFLVMAATLTQIKSRMLLPAQEEEPDDEDPRLEIVRPLAEYLQIKTAAEHLAERNLLGERTFIRSAGSKEYAEAGNDEVIKIGLFELIDAFQKILDGIPSDHQVDLTADSISVKDKINMIVEILEVQGSATFTELFSDEPDKAEVIVTFLAILEMVKLCLVRVVQHVATGVIRLFYL